MGAFVCSDMVKRAAGALSGDGTRVLVLGASGALGSVLLQLLRARKAHVTAVCSGAHAETVVRMGADEAVDYTASGGFGGALASAAPFAVVFDFVGGLQVEREAAPLVKTGGLYVTAVGERQYVGDRKLRASEFFTSVFRLLGRSLCGCAARYRYVMSGAYPPLKAEMWRTAVLEAGARAAVAEQVPFAEEPLRQALRRVATHHAGGRVVLDLERRG